VEHELRASPWVLDVRHVRRVLPNRLSIDLAFRKPAALVAHGTEAYMIDTDGYWLPDGERDGLFHRPKRWQGANAPVLVNHRLNHHPPRGRPWGGPAQAVGARLYTFLEAKGLFTVLPVVEIDVTNVGRTTGPGVEPEILLTTRDGVEVKWGRCDAYADVPGLTHLSPFYSDERKLQMLSAKIREYPSLEGLQYIDLRFNKFFFRTAPQPPTDAEPAP
jgi:cell division septal protein FtsQ